MAQVECRNCQLSKDPDWKGNIWCKKLHARQIRLPGGLYSDCPCDGKYYEPKG